MSSRAPRKPPIEVVARVLRCDSGRVFLEVTCPLCGDRHAHHGAEFGERKPHCVSPKSKVRYVVTL
jgi:hypothetical protein